MRWLDRLLARFRRKPAARPLLSLSEREPADAPTLIALDVVPSPPIVDDLPPRLAPAPQEVAAVAEIELAPLEAYPAAAPVVELEEEVETRDFEEEADAEVDPFDGVDEGLPLDVRLLQALDEVPVRRASARAAALERPHRIALTDAAGPGSLAEALIALEHEGLVTCDVETDEAGEPYLSYAPIPVHEAAGVGRTTPDDIPSPLPPGEGDPEGVERGRATS